MTGISRNGGSVANGCPYFVTDDAETACTQCNGECCAISIHSSPSHSGLEYYLYRALDGTSCYYRDPTRAAEICTLMVPTTPLQRFLTSYTSTLSFLPPSPVSVTPTHTEQAGSLDASTLAILDRWFVSVSTLLGIVLVGGLLLIAVWLMMKFCRSNFHWTYSSVEAPAVSDNRPTNTPTNTPTNGKTTQQGDLRPSCSRTSPTKSRYSSIWRSHSRVEPTEGERPLVLVRN